MKETATHYYCSLLGSTQAKSKLNNKFMKFLKEMDGKICLASDVEKIELNIIEKAKELNEEYPHHNPLEITFWERQESGYIILIGFKYCTFYLKPSHLIEL